MVILEIKNQWTKGAALKFKLQYRDDFAAFYQVILNRSYEFLDLEEGDIVLDAGAHVGVFTVLACKMVGDKGIVVSVEPHPFNFRRLLQNIKLNGCENVILVNKALTDESNREVFISGSGVFAHIGDQGFRCKSISLRDLQKELNLKFTKIKMDIEGSEGEVLLSSYDYLQKVKRIAVEVHDEKNYDLALKALKEAGFYLLESPAESLSKVIIEALKDPFTTVKLEMINRFRTARRVLKDTLIGKNEKFPILLYGIKTSSINEL